MSKKFTHIGTLSGDARTGGRSFETKLRLTPSGSHWVDTSGRRYRRTGGGYVGQPWPMYYLNADSIREIVASAGEAGTAETVKQGSVHEHAVPEGQTPDPSHPSSHSGGR